MDAKTYCLDCIHTKVCGWYPREGCELFVSVDDIAEREGTERRHRMPDWIGISALMILIFALGYVWGRLGKGDRG